MEFVPRVLSAACPEARAEVASAAKRAAGDTNLLRLAQVKKEPLRELCFSQGGHASFGQAFHHSLSSRSTHAMMSLFTTKRLLQATTVKARV